MLLRLPTDILASVAIRSENIKLLPVINDSQVLGCIADALFTVRPRDVISWLVRNQRLEQLRLLANRYRFNFTDNNLITALRTGSIELVDYLRQSVALRYDALTYAVESGSQPLFEHLLRLGYYPSESTLLSALQHGHVELVRRITTLSELTVTIVPGAITSATYSGRLELVSTSLNDF